AWSDAKAKPIALRLRDITLQLVEESQSRKAKREKLARLTEDQERLQAKLSQLAAEAAVKEKPFTPKAVADALPKDAVLIDYLFYGHIEAKGGKAESRPSLVAFVIRKGNKPARVDLGLAAPIKKAVKKWRAALVANAATERAEAKK